MNRDVGGYGVNYDDFKQLCRKSLEEENKYICIDRFKIADQGRYCICNETKST